MRRSLFALALSLFAPVVLTVARAQVLDQSFVDTTRTWASMSNPDLSFERAQTVTIGLSGMLWFVDVLRQTNISSPVTLRVLATAGGLPNGTVLCATTVHSIMSDGWDRFDLSAGHLGVLPGEVLAIEPIGLLNWAGTSTEAGSRSLYPGGMDLYRWGTGPWSKNPPQDEFFRTWLDRSPTAAEHTSWGRLKWLFR
jgi:hypothetical protein